MQSRKQPDIHSSDEKAEPNGRNGSRSRQKRSVVTKEALLTAARRLFAEKGYYETGTNDLVAGTSVSRGALYHHFSSKEDIFESVLRDIAAELYARAADSVSNLSGDTWAQLTTATRAYLSLVANSQEVQRILLIDGPSVLGWEKWRDIQSENILKGMVITLEMLIERDIIKNQPTEPLARLILAVQNDAALEIAHASDPKVALEEMAGALNTIILGLRQR